MTAQTLKQPALKEWSAAVHGLLDGRQTVLLRKGGIHEKRFALSASRFFFFPTVAHSHTERVRPEHHDLLAAAAADSTEAEVVLRAGAKVVAAIEVGRPESLDEIEALHIWTAASVRADRLDFRPNTVSPCWWCRPARCARPCVCPAHRSTPAVRVGCRCPSIQTGHRRCTRRKHSRMSPSRFADPSAEIALL